MPVIDVDTHMLRIEKMDAAKVDVAIVSAT